MNVNWTTIKQFIDSRNISIQWVELEQDYKLIASDDYFKLECSLDKNPTDNTYLTDFETNYKGNGNKVYKTEVVTQLEKDDKTLKIAKAYDDVDAIQAK